LHERLAEQVRDTAWRRPEPGVAAEDYDVVSGAAGITASAAEMASVADVGGAVIGPLLDYLVWLGGPGHNWHIPPRHVPLAEYRERYPDGYDNVGMAHGVPGPRAAQAVAGRAGPPAPGPMSLVNAT
jgi:hypothetical protein